MDSEALIPPIPRPLKRSASVASLPTPPRTRHKGGKRRGCSRGSVASDSDDGSGSDAACRRGRIDTSDEEALGEETDGKAGGKKANVHKRRRTNETVDDEDAFWLSTSVVAPVSPPPSRRKPAPSASSLTLRTPSASPPSTPTKPKPKAKREQSPKRAPRTQLLVDELPVRDSPNNPFLDSPSEGRTKATTRTTDKSNVGSLKLKSPRTPPPRTDEEKPTITYVFRGVRGVYPNPLYNHAKKRPRTPPPQSLLPPEHPDYSPDMRCPPRLLFPKPSKPSSSSFSDDDSDSTYDGKESSDQSPGQGPKTPTRTRTDKKPTQVGADKCSERGKDKGETFSHPRMRDAAASLFDSGRASRSRGQVSRSPLPYRVLVESDDEAGGFGFEGVEDDDDVFGKVKPLKLDSRKSKEGKPRTGMCEHPRPSIVPLRF